jgi:hypothetical protein
MSYFRSLSYSVTGHFAVKPVVRAGQSRLSAPAGFQWKWGASGMPRRLCHIAEGLAEATEQRGKFTLLPLFRLAAGRLHQLAKAEVS